MAKNRWGVVCGKLFHKDSASLCPEGGWLQYATSLLRIDIKLFDTRKEARQVAKRLTNKGYRRYHAKKYEG